MAGACRRSDGDHGAGMRRARRSTWGSSGSWFSRRAGVSILITSLAAGLLLPLVMSVFAGALEEGPLEEAKLPELLRLCLEQRAWTALLGLPPFVCGLILLFDPPSRTLWIALGYLLLLVPVALAVYIVISVLAPLYQVQPI